MGRGGGTRRTLLTSLSLSSCSSSLSARLSLSPPLRGRMLSQSFLPTRVSLRFRPLYSTSSAVAFPTTETDGALQPIKHSALLQRLGIRHLKDKKKKKNEVLTEELMGALTEIQSIGVPAILQGKTVVLGSHTGSGKTLAYMLLPLVQLLRRDEVLRGKLMKPRRPRAVVLCSTRELNEQIFRVSKSICHHARFRVTMISGGTSIELQEDSLNFPIDMVIGTPGRVLQHIADGNMVYGDGKYVVLDEADTMFDRGFGPEIRKFLAPLKNRASKSDDDGFQTILVSATMTKGVQSLVDKEFQGILHLRTSTLHKKIASARHDFIKLSGSENKLEALLQVLEPSLAKGNRVMTFCNTLNSSRAVDHYLTENSVSTVNYHGELPAEERIENLEKFKSDDGDCPTLVCTDLAARGLDQDVDHVIMFDFPKNSIGYLHRTGRTARMGAKGKETILIAKKDQLLAKRIEEAITKNESLESLSVDNVRRDIARSKKTEQKNIKAAKFSMEKNNKKVLPTNSSSSKEGKVITSKTKSEKVSVPLRSFEIYLSCRGQFVSQIQKCIPRKWKRTVKKTEAQSTYRTISQNQGALLQATSTISVAFMTDSLFKSLMNFADQGNLTKAIRVYSFIQKHAASRSSSELILQSLSCLMLCCINLRAFPQGKQLHAYVISLGLERDPKLVPKLITFYSSFGLLQDAHVITRTSNILHPLPWNLLISSYVRHGLHRSGFGAYSEMIKTGVRPDNFTYPSLLKACAGEVNLNLGRVLHKTIKLTCLDWCVHVQNALVSMYGKCGDIHSARVLFEEMLDKDAVSWNSIISAYASNGMWAEAFELFQEMRLNSVEINMITWNTIIGGCLRIGEYGGTLECLSEMRKCILHLDSVSLCIGLSACSHIGALTLGKEIHALAIRSILSELDNVKNALVTLYSRCKELNRAYMLFKSVEVKDIISWNSIISGFAHWECYEKASFLLRKMFPSGIEPNFITLVSIISLCGRIANLQHGKEIHCYITRRVWIKDDLLLWNGLIDMYARSGKIHLARQLFDLLSQRNEVTYTSLISGYGLQGEGRTALGLFAEMIKFQIKPDHVTMVAVLSACSHSCLIIPGERLFSKMQSVYGITPCFEHFSCMVDLYGRAGLLKKAKAIIMKMPYKPTAAICATLINACRIHGNTEIGEWASERLLEMRPNNAGYYVMIANAYAASGSWDKLAKVRILMRDLGIRKPPGCAWVNVGAGSFSFLGRGHDKS